MATLYCDHGAYHLSAQFEATFTTTTMNVTSVSSGTISVGMSLSGSGILADQVVISYGTGTGGIGTYILRASNTLTGTRSVTGTDGAPSQFPAWGVAQDGDGTTKDRNTAVPATVEIDLAGVSATTGNTFTILGAILTAGSSATNTTFLTGNGSTLVDNLVNAINRVSGTLASCVPLYDEDGRNRWTTHQLCNAVFARAKPGTPTTLQIMTRAGSAKFNGGVVSQLGMTGFAGGQSGPWLFSGGVGGVWGHFISVNDRTLGNKGAGGYGILYDAPVAGGLLGGDIVKIRSDKVIRHLNSNGTFGTGPAVINSSATAPVKFIIDDGTEWPVDGTGKSVEVRWQAGGSAILTIPTSTNIYSEIIAPYNHDTGYYGLVLNAGQYNSQYGAVQLTSSINRLMRGFHCIFNSSASAYSAVQNTGSPVQAVTIFDGFKVTLNSNSLLYGSTSSSSAMGLTRLENFVLDNGSFASENSGIISEGGSGSLELQLENFKCLNFQNGSALFRLRNHNKTVSIRKANLGGITKYGAMVNQLSAGTNYAQEYRTESTVVSTDLPGRTIMIDCRQGFVEWNSARTFPVLNARHPEGNGWSLRAVPSSVDTMANAQYRYFRLPIFSKFNTLPDGARTVTLEFCVKDTVSATKANIFAKLRYITTDGSVVDLSSRIESGGSHTPSNATWSQESNGQVTYDDGGIMYFNKYKIIFTTPPGKNMKQNTDVICDFFLNYLAVQGTDMVFVDPDIGIV